MCAATIIDAGRHELYHLDKKLTTFTNIVSSTLQARNHKGPFSPEVLKDVRTLWFHGPTRDLKPEESAVIENFVVNGGSLFICASKLPPVFSDLLKKFGVTLGEEIISPTYITYIDPHQVIVQHGLVNRALTQYTQDPNTSFAFPNGVTIEMKHPSVPVLTSGQSSYPLNRPIVSFAKIGKKNGSVSVFGSPHMFCDEWIRKESNDKLLQFFLDLTVTRNVELNQIDAEHPEITERWYTPDVASMSERLRCCIQESEKLRTNFNENFEAGLFKMDMSFVAQAQELAQKLGLKGEQLDIVTPQFDTALPPLTPAVFPPQMREPPGPVLELFDLDDAFASPKSRLAQLAQRTSPKNVEKFVIQAAKILGILPKLPADKQTGKHVLEYVLTQVVRWKRQG